MRHWGEDESLIQPSVAKNGKTRSASSQASVNDPRLPQQNLYVTPPPQGYGFGAIHHGIVPHRSIGLGVPRLLICTSANLGLL